MSLPLKKVEFCRLTGCIGRNGFFKASGLELFRQDRDLDGQIIDVQPRTSRGQLANCHIEIPIESVDAVVQALNALKREPRTRRGKSD